MGLAKTLFNKADQLLITRAIAEAEENTSGEIRVHIEESCKGDVLDQAAYVFGKLNMHQTKLRNGVLFYLAVKNRKFAILGDAGINSKVPENFWDQVKEAVLAEFSQGQLAKGLADGIILAGQQLKVHFPHMTDDINELTDEISFGK